MADVLYRTLDDLSDSEIYQAYEPPEADWLRVNFVSSADGAATLSGLSGPLSGEADKRVFKVLRARCDVLVAGSGTVLAEGYGPLVLSADRMAWRRDQGLPEVPIMAIVSRSARLDPSAAIFTEAPRRPIVICAADAAVDQMAEMREVADVIAIGTGSVDFPAAIRALRERGLRQILCEGGPTVFGELIAADAVDELCLTVSPLLVGAGAPRIAEGHAAESARALRLRHVIEAGGNLIVRYLRGSTDE
ncbi:pyrimidine reductase family protein [Glycomyces buryatensis]|uniref:Pyrimidine reductase family protein n=1 Tax=Glycomyces buryatensis TaxID=2570927 RepID=A0A4S8QFM7_9ACTN|nr:pyrimidine reductase family protein [Glycomyces buryatensis]THV43497.1 pyrimidine reductase family protein [Glycomyces buryatensis]